MEHKRAVPNSQKTRNESLILQLLRVRGVSSVTELSRISGLGKATVSRAVSSLREQGLIDETGDDFRRASVGRGGRSLRVNPQSALYLGVAIGPGMINIVLADAAKQVLSYVHRDLADDIPVENAVETALQLADEALDKASCDRASLVGIGIAIGAPVDPRKGVAASSSLVPNWVGVEVRQAFKKHFDLPVFIDNESNCSALAEILWGGAPQEKAIAFIKFDRGVGGAIIFDGEVRRGHSGYVGEFGHIPYDRHGPYCRCGNRGCFEKFVSIAALMEKVSEVDADISFEQVIAQMPDGNPALTRIVRELGEIAGELIHVISRTVDPDLYLLGGDMMLLGPTFVDAAIDRYKSLNIKTVPVKIANAARVLSDDRQIDEPALGAIGLVLKQSGPVH